MFPPHTIYILGAGAIGLPLAAHLTRAGRSVVAVRTSRDDIERSSITVSVGNDTQRISSPVETISLAKLPHLDGLLVVTTKAYANRSIADTLKAKAADGPIVIMQNGVGVEQPFLDDHFSRVYRCVLYSTSFATAENTFTFHAVNPSLVGIITGNEDDLAHCVEQLYTDGFPFRVEPDIQRAIWKKAIINTVYNSICPLLDTDNGVFAREATARSIAQEIVQECVLLMERLHIGLGEQELMDLVMFISERSHGQVVSTLQDLRRGSPTEIDALNLEIARIAGSLEPPLAVPRIALLGRMIEAKGR